MLKGGGACCVRAMTPGLGGPPGREEAATLMLLGAGWSSVLALKPMSRASRRKTLWCVHARAEGQQDGVTVCGAAAPVSDSVCQVERQAATTLIVLGNCCIS
jgi:hypothetical protein